MSEASPLTPGTPKTIVAIGDRRAGRDSYFDIGWVVSMDADFVTLLSLPILGGGEKRYMREEITMTDLAKASSGVKDRTVVPFQHADQQPAPKGVELRHGAARRTHKAKKS